MYHYWTVAEVPNDEENVASFVVELKNETKFILNGCYFTIYKEMFEKYPDSDYFQIDLYSESEKKTAEEKIKRAVDILVYITGIVYEVGNVRQDTNIQLPIIDINYSKAKLTRINAINSQYERIRSKKELLENSLRLYTTAEKYILVLEDVEEAFFAYFRILEKIAKSEFGIEGVSIDNGHYEVRIMLQNIIGQKYGIKYPSNKLDDLSGKYASEIFDTIFSDSYAKIAWFCSKHGIEYDEEVLGRAVKLRNKLAHGDNVIITFEDAEYELVSYLAYEFIHIKFFSSIKKCFIGARVIC